MDKASRTTCPLGSRNRRGPGCAIHKPIDVIARCGALRGDPRRHANERRGGWEQEISPHEPGVMTDAGEHERDEPYNGPRDSSGPSIRDEEAPPPPHLKVTAFPRSAAPKDARPDKAVHGRGDAEHREHGVNPPGAPNPGRGANATRRLPPAPPFRRDLSGRARGEQRSKALGRETFPRPPTGLLSRVELSPPVTRPLAFWLSRNLQQACQRKFS